MTQVSKIVNSELRVLGDPLLLARLVESVGTRKGDRPMIPYDAAKTIKALIDDIKKMHRAKNNELLSDNRAMEDAARRLGVTASTCQEFLHVLKMPPSWRGVLAFHGKRSGGRLPFTIARKLAPRYESGKLSENDLSMLMGVAVNQNATRDDIEDIVIYKDKNESLPLTECIKHIMNLTPIITTGFVTISDVNPVLVEKAKVVLKTSEENAVRALLMKKLGKEAISGVQIKHKSYVQIVFRDKAGSDKFYNLAEKCAIPPNALVNNILSTEIGDSV